MADELPNVGRPRGGEWRRLQSEGIIWEGQILITGEDVDLAALLIVTPNRLALVRGGSVALDIDREWLYPEPVLRRTGTVLVWLSEQATGSTETMGIIVRSGREEAARLVSLLTRNEESWATLPAIDVMAADSYDDPSPFDYARSFHDPDQESGDHVRRSQPPNEIVPVFSVLDDDDFPPIEHVPAETQTIIEPFEIEEPNREPAPVAEAAIELDGPLAPISGFESKINRDRRSWVIRLSGLMVLFALIAGISSGLIPSWNDLRDAASPPPPSIVAVADGQSPADSPSAPTNTPTAEPTQPSAPTATSESPSLADADDPTLVPQETALAMGVGSSDSPETETPTSEPEPTLTPTPPATSTTEPEPTAAPTETLPPSPTPTSEPTNTPSTSNTVGDVEPASVALQDDPTPTIDTTPVIPTAIPTEDLSGPTQTPEVVPTEPSEDPTEAVPTVEETEQATEPEQPDASSQLTSQPSTLDANETPRQTFAVGGVRVAIDEAVRGQSIPDLTLGPLPDGEWVVLLLAADNWSGSQQELTLADFRILSLDDPSTEYPLDSATGGVASYLAYSPALKASDTASISAGGSQQLALVFVAPEGSQNLAIRAGDQVVALVPAFNEPHSGGTIDLESGTAPLASGTVVDVLDGRTIVVESDGSQITVQYVGVGVPEPGACYAEEATVANTDLVVGQIVYFERERRNRVSSETYLRDVWVPVENGSLTHVGAALAGSGSVVSEPVAPDTRYAGLIAGESAIANSDGLGIWGACTN